MKQISTETETARPNQRIGRVLACPDCHQDLDLDIRCPVCRRSFLPDPDGIISAMPKELNYEAWMGELQERIDHASAAGRDQTVVRFEQAFHDEQAKYYDDVHSDPEPVRTYIHRLVNRTIYERVRNCDLIVDLCCGTGKSSLPLLDRGASVIAIDVSREMLRAYARKAGRRDNLLLIHADATCPPLRPRSCSAILIIGGLHHIPDREACVRNCCSVLNRDGVLILHEPLKTGESHWMLRIIQNLDALSNPVRVARVIGRRVGLYRPPNAAPPERLQFTPYERAFTSARELSEMFPSDMSTVELSSKMVLSDHRFGPHLQPIRQVAGAVVALDEWLSRSGRAGWTGNALFGVFRKLR